MGIWQKNNNDKTNKRTCSNINNEIASSVYWSISCHGVLSIIPENDGKPKKLPDIFKGSEAATGDVL